MQYKEAKSVFYYQSFASALGGFLEKPDKVIPPQATVVLPTVGGSEYSESGTFRLDDIVSCSRASAQVSGYLGSAGFLIETRTEIENLKIRDVVRAAKIVGRVTVEYTRHGRRFSFAGSGFEGLEVDGKEVALELDQALLSDPPRAASYDSRLNWNVIQSIGSTQAWELVKLLRKQGADEPWALNRYEWMQNGPAAIAPAGVDTYTLCSLVNSVKLAGQDSGIRSLSHIVEIPHFGRLFLGELLTSGTSTQLTMLRAELGCSVIGGIHIGTNGGGGHSVPPGGEYR
jgi:hypothetical protein